MALTTQPGTATGGVVFSPQPVVSVQDKGGNTVISQITGSVTVAIGTNAGGGTLTSTDSLTVDFTLGVATFVGLSIDTAGTSYDLTFTTDLVLEAGTVITSFAFSVGLGPAAYINFLQQPSEGTCYAGRTMPVQPIVELLDLGLNRLTTNSESYLLVEIYDNPAGGILSPTDRLYVQLDRGTVTYSGLTIDLASSDYSLLFTMYDKVSGVNTWTVNGLTEVSSFFNVLIGSSFELVVTQAVNAAWAGGQPFQIQPAVSVVDDGGNLISSDSSSVLTAAIVPSLQLVSDLVVDTTAAPDTTVVKVTCANADGDYGVGQIITIHVQFDQDVFIDDSVLTPTLALNSGDAAVAYAVTVGVYSTVIVFEYEVEAGDSSAKLDYDATDSLSLGTGAILVDGNGATPDLTLPGPGDEFSLSDISEVVIDTDAPTILEVYCTDPGDGTYAPGEVLYILVEFSASVVVTETPELYLVWDDGTSVAALYTSGSGTHTLQFTYTVEDGFETADLSLDPAVTSIQLPAADLDLGTTDALILRSSTTPTTAADLDLSNAVSLSANNDIVITSVAPVVDPSVGVTSSTAAGTYSVGDVIYIDVTFDVPVTVVGSPLLTLEVGNADGYADLDSGSGTNTLTFKYTVKQDAVSADLDYASDSALDTTDTTIRYTSDTPTVDADVSLAAVTLAGKSLADNAAIVVDGVQPSVASVALASGYADGTFETGDVVGIEVTFTKDVTVHGTPTLALDMSTVRYALYSSGNETSTLTFLYTVLKGDTATDLDYVATGSLVADAAAGAYIRRYSSAPSLAASLTLPSPGAGISDVVIDTSAASTTTVSSVWVEYSAGEYGTGESLNVYVTFTDEVFVDGTVQLQLNIMDADSDDDASDTSPRAIDYVLGSGTDTLGFSLSLLAGDAVDGLDFYDADSLLCDVGCTLVDAVSGTVDISLASVASLTAATYIVVDTAAPVVTSVSSPLAANAINGGVYVAGDALAVEVTFDKPVTVSGTPLLALQFDAGTQSAVYSAISDDSTVLTFSYTVTATDVSGALAVSSSAALTLNSGLASIRRSSTTPTTAADRTLADPASYSLAADGNDIVVDGALALTVVRVVCLSSAGTYTGGDTLQFEMEWSGDVTVSGTPLLYLELGTLDSAASYISGSGSTNLTFEYTIAAGEHSRSALAGLGLDYTDSNALLLNGGSLLLSADVPTTMATLTLPHPGESGSISGDHGGTITVNTDVPYITAISLLSPTAPEGGGDVTMYLGDAVEVGIDFSHVVVVVGAPLLAIETGDNDRQAVYSGGSGTAQLTFVYTAMTGDASAALDYTDSYALLLPPGASIRRLSAAPLLDANTLLNPPKGFLRGTVSATMSEGVASWKNLRIDEPGSPYTLHVTTGDMFVASEFVVEYSSEYEVVSDDAFNGDRFGHSVDILGDVALVGALLDEVPLTEVQTVSVNGGSGVLRGEVQIFKSEADWRPEIQTVTSTADPYERLGGSFRLYFGSLGPTRLIAHDALPETVRANLMEDIPAVGEISVSRQPYTWCACLEAFTWSVTFDSFRPASAMLMLLGDGEELTGAAAAVGDGVHTQDVTTLGGSFRLLMGSWQWLPEELRWASEDAASAGEEGGEPALLPAARATNYTTRLMDVDITADALRTVLEEDFGLPVVYTHRSDADDQGGYTWTVTFGATETHYDLPRMVADTTEVEGHNARIWVSTVSHGQAPISGFWRASWRGEGPASDLPFNASAAELEGALLELPHISAVTVSRIGPNSTRGYEWTVTFEETLQLTEYGWKVEIPHNLEPLEVEQSFLGTGPSIEVGYVFGGSSLPFSNARAGSYGTAAGAAYLFKRDGRQWQQLQKLQAGDTDDFDYFGFSVSLTSGVAVIGAVAAEELGVPETQILVCNANGGTLTFIWGYYRSDPVPYDVTYDQLEASIETLHGITDVYIEPFEGPFCNVPAPEVLMTFIDPQDGDMTEIGLDASLLQGGEIIVGEWVKGTLSVSGVQSTQEQAGAAYVFREAGDGTWEEEAKLFTEPRSPGDQFGYSTAIDGDLLAVSAPGMDTSRGAVFTFGFDAPSESWVQLQRLDADLFIHTSGDKFGTDIALDGDTLVATAQWLQREDGRAGQGGVYVFVIDSAGLFVLNQELLASDGVAGDLFGYSVSLDANTIAVGAPRATGVDGQLRAGAAYTFYREGSEQLFFETQRLNAGQDSRRLDQFGIDVDVSGNVLLVGMHEDFDVTELFPRASVQVVRTTGAGLYPSSDSYDSGMLGGTFKLRWNTQRDGHIWADIESRDLLHDASVLHIAAALQEDLNTGLVRVSRTAVDASTGGYSWSVTFLEQEGEIETLTADGSALTGNAPSVGVTMLWNSAPPKRGKAYTFTRDEANLGPVGDNVGGLWTLQAMLVPLNMQDGDMFGTCVAVDALSGGPARGVVGAWNRDSFVSEVNGGGAVLYNLDFLNAHFSSQDYSVTEGDTLTVSLQRCGGPDVDENVCVAGDVSEEFEAAIYTLDVNSGEAVQDAVRRVYGLNPLTDVGVGETVVSVTTGASAHARGQSYGSAEMRSLWIDAQFDYRGVSDYLTQWTSFILPVETTSMDFELPTTDDPMLEAPDESLRLLLRVIGMVPVREGSLMASIVIEDDGDGLGPDLDGYYQKIFPPEEQPAVDSQFGSAIAVDDTLGVLLVGRDQTTVDDLPWAGTAFVYYRVSGVWTYLQELQPPDGAAERGLFGQSVAVDYTGLTLLVGAPGSSEVHVFINSDGVADTLWTFEDTLSVAGVASVSTGFGASRAIALDRDIVAVGAWGLESVFVFERTVAGWSEGKLIRSLDFDFDLIYTVPHLHMQQFGFSVDVSGRTVAVGAPTANYRNKGTFEVEDFDTDGDDNMWFGTGKAFVFYRRAQKVALHLLSDTSLTDGTFQLYLNHRNVELTTTELSHSATAAEVESALEALSSVDDVTVSRTSVDLTTEKGYTWSITFDAEVVSVPTLVPQWSGYGCDACIALDQTRSAAPALQLHMTLVQDIGEWAQQDEQGLQAFDAQYADRFGHDVAIDGQQIVVAAVDSSGVTTTTWDFEGGDLVGWMTTGTAFDYQPTFGDNSGSRSTYDGFKGPYSHGRGQSSRLEGRYYVGTYELRPGAGVGDYANPSPSYAAGSTQGDAPVGSMTSESFLIQGRSIRLLIGGGCDPATEYVELLVEEVQVYLATGRCAETMYEVEWDVSMYMGRGAQIRVVDNSASQWGHINLDFIRFDWAIQGGAMHYSGGEYVHYNMKEETPMSGVAYTFRLREPDPSIENCGDEPAVCVWDAQTRLQASDKRRADRFGVQVDVDATHGVVVVGAPGQRALDKHRGEIWPDLVTGDEDARAAGRLGRGATDESGAVYLFRREPELRGGQGNLIKPSYFPAHETARLQAADGKPRDRFGSALALSGHTLFVGAPGVDEYGDGSGAVYFVDVAFQTVQFDKEEFVAVENNGNARVDVKLVRTGDATRALTLHYAVSDISAVSVDSTKYDECMALALARRYENNCMDYEQTAGYVTMAAGDTSVVFYVPIVDDNCYEHNQERAMVTLSIPGGDVLLGYEYVAYIRIDDNDFGATGC